MCVPPSPSALEHTPRAARPLASAKLSRHVGAPSLLPHVTFPARRQRQAEHQQHRGPVLGTPSTPDSSASISFLETATLPQLHRIDPRGALWYERALELARQQQWGKARRVFQAIAIAYPNLCRAWVSWAQMEKKASGDITHKDFDSCRSILQRGLELNPRSSCLCQAWGLMELQRGNSLAAVKLLDRSAVYDPNCKPVQRWKLYKDARHKCRGH